MFGHKIVVMKKKPVPKVGYRPRGELDWIPAATFKATCLELMDRVKETGTPLVVTKHGRPVAKLVPYDAAERSGLFGSMAGTVLKYDRPFDPVEGEYDIEQS
jgi:prevent-host-death family protein